MFIDHTAKLMEFAVSPQVLIFKHKLRYTSDKLTQTRQRPSSTLLRVQNIGSNWDETVLDVHQFYFLNFSPSFRLAMTKPPPPQPPPPPPPAGETLNLNDCRVA